MDIESGIKLLCEYFDLSEKQKDQFSRHASRFLELNEVHNLISRKDVDNLFERHILHSLSLALYLNFPEGARILDVGTGGGFPGLPLAILRPDLHITLIDSTAKKIKAVRDLIDFASIENARAEQIRAESYQGKADFIISRAVTSLDKFTRWVHGTIDPGSFKGTWKGIAYLRGPDVDIHSINDEIHPGFDCSDIKYLNHYLNRDFFSTKTVVFLKRI